MKREPVKYKFILTTGRALYVSHYADRDGVFDIMFPDHSREQLPVNLIQRIDPCYGEKYAHYIDRNQNTREAVTLLQTSLFDLVYYFMPNGAMYLNRLFVDSYDTLPPYKAIKFVKTELQRIAFIQMLENHIEYLNDLKERKESSKRFWVTERNANKAIENNRHLIEQAKQLKIPAENNLAIIT